MVAIAGRGNGRRRPSSTTAPAAIAPAIESGPRDPQAAAGLELHAVQIGQAWADRCFDELTQAGRQIVDGWPGTMSEARDRVLGVLRPHVRPPALSTIEVRSLARQTYVAAKARWLGRAERNLHE